MNTQRKKSLSVLLITSLVLSMIMTLGIPSVMAQEAIVSVIDPLEGDDTVVLPADSPVGTTFLVNITIMDVEELAGWQINVTYDPILIQIADDVDMLVPADHVFASLDPMFPNKDINNDVGFVMWGCAVGPAAPVDHFTGSGTICQIRFTTMRNGSGWHEGECELVLDREGLFATILVGPWCELLSFDTEDFHYFIETPPRLFGDLNDDGKVDIQDLVLFIKAFASYPTHPRWNVWADLRVDDKVDIIDLVLLIKNFGKHTP